MWLKAESSEKVSETWVSIKGREFIDELSKLAGSE
jgi:hypothetical protein